MTSFVVHVLQLLWLRVGINILARYKMSLSKNHNLKKMAHMLFLANAHPCCHGNQAMAKITVVAPPPPQVSYVVIFAQ